jgi:hypothetical protein
MSAFDQDDIRLAIAVQVADAGVRRGLGSGLQRNNFKGRHGCEAEQDNGESCS